MIKKRSTPSAPRKAPAPASPKPHTTEAHARMTGAEHYAAGKALRNACPRNAHATWKTPAHRPDAVQMILDAESSATAGRSVLPLRFTVGQR